MAELTLHILYITYIRIHWVCTRAYSIHMKQIAGNDAASSASAAAVVVDDDENDDDDRKPICND